MTTPLRAHHLPSGLDIILPSATKSRLLHFFARQKGHVAHRKWHTWPEGWHRSAQDGIRYHFFANSNIVTDIGGNTVSNTWPSNLKDVKVAGLT
mgnify:CR=1 FL=1